MHETEPADEPALIHCIYTSALSPGYDDSVLESILATARARNGPRGISGMLLFDDGSFFQILEGEESTVLDLYERIGSDERHDQITKLIQEPIEERAFADWTMGVADITRTDLEKLDGMNDFFRNGRGLAELDPGRAKSLLNAFRDGKWRAAIR